MRCHTAAREARLQRAHCVRRENEEKTPAYPAPCLHGLLLARPPAYSSDHHLLVCPPLTRPPPAYSSAPRLLGRNRLARPPACSAVHQKRAAAHVAPKITIDARCGGEKKKTCLTQKKPYRVGILAASRVGNPGGRDTWAFRVEEQCSYLPTDRPGGDPL